MNAVGLLTMAKRPQDAMGKSDKELTITIRAFELGYFMALGKCYTLAQVAEEFELSPSGAYRLLARASGSKRVPLRPPETDGLWTVEPEE